MEELVERVIEISFRESDSDTAMAKLFGKFAQPLFGIRPVQPLANDKWECLRCYCVLTLRRSALRYDKENELISEHGFTRHELMHVQTRLSLLQMSDKVRF